MIVVIVVVNVVVVVVGDNVAMGRDQVTVFAVHATIILRGTVGHLDDTIYVDVYE